MGIIMKKLATLTISSFALLIANQALAQNSPLSFDRVFSDPPISGPSAKSPKLSPDGQILTYLLPKTDNAMVQDLWGVKAKGGAPFLILDADKLSNQNKELSEAEKARRERMRLSTRGVVEYKWDQTGKAILVPLDGDIYSIDAKSFKTNRITQTPDDEIDASLSPNGQKMAYVRNGQLIVRDIANNSEIEFSPPSSENISYAIADFIAEEEQDRHTGYWWSPKSDAIAYTMVDETNVDIVPRMEISGNGAKVINQKYPRAGRPNAIVDLYVKEFNSAPIKIDLGANKDIYLARVNWAKDSKTLYVQRLSRDQKTLDLMVFDQKTGKGATILTEKSDSWVELNDDFHILKSGDFIWASERDGNNHLYLYDKNAKLKTQITKGNFATKGINAIDENAGLIYFTASPKTPIETNLYSTKIDGSGAINPITAEGGVWGIEMAKSAKSFIGAYSAPNTPPNMALYDKDGKRLRFITENKLDKNHPYYAHSNRYGAPEFGTLKADDGANLMWSMLKPIGFDENKKYPVIVYIYGGPAKAMVTKSWVSPNLRLLQEAGYIVFTIDNRGTPGRDVKFTRAIYKNFGGADIDDQIKGAKFLQSLKFVDANNIGIHGWSQGGFVTLMALSVKDTPFKAGVAGAPPTKWDLYDTAYTERYMAMPSENIDGYAKSDVLNRLENIKPNSLMIMHGMADDNVLLDNTTRVMGALQAKGIAFESMLYPGERHGLKGHLKKKHQWQLMLDYFDRHLKQ
jgi:dipeptidyl-peptidase 4